MPEITPKDKITAKEKIRIEAAKLITEAPNGIRYTDLKRRIWEIYKDMAEGTLTSGLRSFRLNPPQGIQLV